MSCNTKSFEEKLTDPAGVYGNPDDVLRDEALSNDEKIAVLREWYQDAVRLQASEGENMGGGEADRLRAVSNALLKLNVAPAEECDSYRASQNQGGGVQAGD